MAEPCHYCKHDLKFCEPGARARIRYETYGGDPFFIYVQLCGRCARTLNHGAEVLEDGDPIELEQITWREDKPVDSPIEPAVKGEQRTLDEQAQLNLFKEGK